MHKPGKAASTRIELRLPDPSCNPYLMLAATLAAGMKGVEDELPLQEESTVDVSLVSERELAAKGIQRLPRDLGEAIDAFADSELMRETLGDHIVDYLLAEKRAEWEEYNAVVTDWERHKYYAGF
jgi:glutamine synthetase